MRAYAMALVAGLMILFTLVNPSQGAALPGAPLGPAKMTTVNLISSQEMIVTLSDEAVKARVLFSYQIKSAPVLGLSITVPEGWQAVNVQGEALGKWTQSGRTIKVPLSRKVSGEYYLLIELEKIRSAASGEETIPEVTTDGASREAGYVGLIVSPSLEAEVKKADRLVALDPEELPERMVSATDQPILYCYRFTQHPYEAKLKLTRNQDVKSLAATIDTVNLVAIFTKDGQAVTRVIYEVRNNRKQYLKLVLPEKAEIWSTLVEDKPVKAYKNDKGEVLIPLRLAKSSDEPPSFTVELIYYSPGTKLDKRGDVKSIFPKVDLPVSEIMATLYLPLEFKYSDFEGTLEKIETPEYTELGTLPVLPATPAAGPGTISKLKALGYLAKGGQMDNSSRAVERQNKMELEIADEVRQKRGEKSKFDDYSVARYGASPEPTAPPKEPGSGSDKPAPDKDGTMAVDHMFTTPPEGGATTATGAFIPKSSGRPFSGALPVKFSVPLRGQVFRFSKLVVVNEAPTLNFHYKKSISPAFWQKARLTGKIALFVLVALLLAALIRWIWKRPRPTQTLFPIVTSGSPLTPTPSAPPPLAQVSTPEPAGN